MGSKYNRYNFHKYTFCEFQEVEIDAIEGLTCNYQSKSGSAYYFTAAGVYRKSNHWGRVANCRWRLVTLMKDQISKTKVGYAKWSDFYNDNETDALYFIQIIKSADAISVTFQHKNHSDYQSENNLRTGSATAKVIRQINEVLTTDTWAKYLDIDNLEAIREDIVQQLISSRKTIQEIKRMY